MSSDFSHMPVMLNEVIAAMNPKDGETYVDGTLGGAGYAEALLANAECHVVGIDRDPVAVAHGQNRHTRLQVIAGNFGRVHELIPVPVEGFMLDLGVSSVQLDTPARGFSFRSDGPLDMRMNPEEATLSAADIVNTYGQEDLANLIYRYGEERKSRRVAAAIIKARNGTSITSTIELAEIVRRVVPKSPKDKVDPATRTFQALRIAVNDELGELERALEASVHILKPGGRLVVVTFHSLEDGLVKRFLRDRSGYREGASRHLPQTANHNESPLFHLLFRKAIGPSQKEVAVNPRARSAKLRAAIRTGEAVAA